MLPITGGHVVVLGTSLPLSLEDPSALAAVFGVAILTTGVALFIRFPGARFIASASIRWWSLLIIAVSGLVAVGVATFRPIALGAIATVAPIPVRRRKEDSIEKTNGVGAAVVEILAALISALGERILHDQQQFCSAARNRMTADPNVTATLVDDLRTILNSPWTGVPPGRTRGIGQRLNAAAGRPGAPRTNPNLDTILQVAYELRANAAIRSAEV
jgi:hypothetical protein